MSNYINKFKKMFVKKEKKGLDKYKSTSKIKKKWLRIFLYTMGAMFLAVVLLFAWYAKDLPTPGKIKDLAPVQSSKIYDRNGVLLYDIHGEQKRTVVKNEDISDLTKNATIAAEDKNFYKHFGVDFKGLARSVMVNIFNRGYAQGGSTITQQYVKNALLTTEKSLHRKIKELILSLEIEAMFSKQDILTMYLNEIPYGSYIYGIEAASETFYGKKAKDLTLDEAATLAAIPQAPTYYSPYGQHPDELLIRRNWVLDRMFELGYIDKTALDEAKSKEIKVVEMKEDIKAPHFVLYVKEKLVEMYGEQAVTEGGYKVTTTLDYEAQKKGEETVTKFYDESIKNYGASNLSLVAIDPKNGQILAMVGSHDFFDTENDGQVNVTISERQPGSSFKPIAYATAFKGNYSPSSTLWDVKTDFGNYTPQNYNGNFNGPVSARFALANSLNIPAVKILYLAGLDNVLKTAHEMGITSLNNPDQYGLSLVLGGGEVKPLDMATAFGVFANKGVLVETTPFIKIEDASGKEIYKPDPKRNERKVFEPEVAYEISSILSDNNARSAIFGPNSPLNFNGNAIAAKTGTTDSFRDAWTNGYTPDLAVSIWVGNNDNTPMYANSDGIVVAAPIFRDFMLKMIGDKQYTFERPEGIKDFTVDKLSGKIPTDQSPEKVTDIFASWQIPKENDNIHVKVKICKACDGEKIANDTCPASQVEEKTYTNLHSEVPDNPSWENPVLEWAKSHGMSLGSPPKETCDLSGSMPSINITSPANNSEVSGNFSIQSTTNAGFGVKEVEYYIDNIKITSSSNYPYSVSYNANNLSSGSHELKAKIIDNKDLTSTNSITIKVVKDTVAPGNATGITLTPIVAGMKIAWNNPSDSDLDIVRIYMSTSSGVIGIKATEVAANPSTASLITIPSLITGQKYYFTIRPVDNSNNENSSTVQYSANPL